ncbi:50S ribosomal protein L14 [candidate division WOR-3 bacterium]|nr:50S ribosomal protein L14 [candidate division WOR-3 bacterium]
MIQVFTRLRIADNSGGKIGLCIGIPGESSRKYAGLGDIITITVKDTLPESQIKKKSIQKAVVIRVRKEHRREDGSYVRFDENACVLITKDREPIGTRIFGPIARELREKRFMKIASLAPEVV